jgi:LmbE family N-acetylglucosaminyl deacetylase
MKKSLIVLVSVVIVSVIAHLLYVSTWRPTEKYPDDTYLTDEREKRALIVVAHDDDAISSAGTVSWLADHGWTIDYVTFYGNWHGEINATRKEELKKACQLEGVRSVNAIDFPIQRTDTVKVPWMPVSYSRFHDYFSMDSIRGIIQSKIKEYQPTVLITLDNVIGGYGHPEHVAVSQACVDVCKQIKTSGQLPVKKIYQAVFTPSQAEKTIGDMPPFIAGKKIYQCNGMPEPSVQINISSQAATKKEVMKTYESQQGPIKKVWPYYNWYPSWIYFGIFNKEYFHVVECNAL